MDIVTHGLASLAIARGFFPRAGKVAMASAVVAGTIADIDWLSNYFGPWGFLTWHGTYTHTILAAVLISAAIFAIPLAAIFRRGLRTNVLVPKDKTISNDTQAKQRSILGAIFVAPFLLQLCAALLHVGMDACQSGGVMLLWPISSRRFAPNWLPGIDPWILTILIAAIALPELLRLVGSEIGAKTKKPRGQTGAIIGLALVLAYIGARATLHSNVLALMESRTFHGESPRRSWAYPESLSLFAWHGVAETESALNEIDVNAASASNFDSDSSLRLFKPESSPALEAARNTTAARRFLASAQIPKASMEKTQTGYIVILRDLRYAAAGDIKHEVAAYIELDPNSKVASQELVWARDLRK